MNFELTQDQRSFKDDIERFAREIVAPRAASIDKSGEYPTDVIHAAAGLGLASEELAKKDGCMGCHDVSAKKMGPSFKSVAAKYKGKADADVIVDGDMIRVMAAMFLGEQGDVKDPLAAPLHADLHGLPPLLIQVGEDETLLDDSVRLAERAEFAGVDVTLEVFPEMQHVFQTACGATPEATAAVQRIGDYLRAKLDLRARPRRVVADDGR